MNIAYNDAGGTRTVTHTIDGTTTQTSTFNVSYLGGRWLPTQISGNCATCPGADADLMIFAYDYANHLMDLKVGSGGDQVESQMTYDGNGMLLKRIEAVGKAETRTTTYVYGYTPPVGSGLPPWPSFMTQMAETSAAKSSASKTTTYAWNTSGTAETTLTVTEAGWLNSTTSENHVTTSTFDSPRHRLLSVTGPGTNQQTAYVYNSDAATNDGGRLQTSKFYTSATAHLDTGFSSYDLYGTALTTTDPNGVQTAKTTDDRGRVTTVVSKHPSNDSNEAGDYTTSYTFDSRDRLTSVALPLSNQIQYGYEDGTNRLTDTIRADATGGHNQQERLHLTLNVIGDKVQEDSQACATPATSCSAWATAARTESFTFDSHNRLQKITHPDATHIDYTYDTRGNLKTVQDENHTTGAIPTTLNRLTTS